MSDSVLFNVAAIFACLVFIASWLSDRAYMRGREARRPEPAKEKEKKLRP